MPNNYSPKKSSSKELAEASRTELFCALLNEGIGINPFTGWVIDEVPETNYSDPSGLYFEQAFSTSGLHEKV